MAEYLPFIVVAVIVVGAIFLSNAWNNRKRNSDNGPKGS